MLTKKEKGQQSKFKFWGGKKLRRVQEEAFSETVETAVTIDQNKDGRRAKPGASLSCQSWRFHLFSENQITN